MKTEQKEGDPNQKAEIRVETEDKYYSESIKP